MMDFYRDSIDDEKCDMDMGHDHAVMMQMLESTKQLSIFQRLVGSQHTTSHLLRAEALNNDPDTIPTRSSSMLNLPSSNSS